MPSPDYTSLPLATRLAVGKVYMYHVLYTVSKQEIPLHIARKHTCTCTCMHMESTCHKHHIHEYVMINNSVQYSIQQFNQPAYLYKSSMWTGPAMIIRGTTPPRPLILFYLLPFPRKSSLLLTCLHYSKLWCVLLHVS